MFFKKWERKRKAPCLLGPEIPQVCQHPLRLHSVSHAQNPSLWDLAIPETRDAQLRLIFVLSSLSHASPSTLHIPLTRARGNRDPRRSTICRFGSAPLLLRVRDLGRDSRSVNLQLAPTPGALRLGFFAPHALNTLLLAHCTTDRFVSFCIASSCSQARACRSMYYFWFLAF